MYANSIFSQFAILQQHFLLKERLVNMTKPIITFLGKDSGFGEKNTSAYAIVNNRLLLIDCGYTVMSQLQSLDLLTKVDGIDVIITHMHVDHVGSLSQLALFSYYALKKPINIISNCSELDNFLTITGASRFRQTPGFPKERYSRNNNFVTFIPTNHVEDEMDCYGFTTTINGTTIVYTGDTTTLKPFIRYLKPGCQLFTDASCVGGVHLNLETNLPLLQKLTEDGIEVYLMHLDNVKKIRELISGTSIKICDD